MIEGVMCSSAMPAAFPFQEFKGNIYVDGGTVKNLDVASAVEQCREIVENDSDIIIDIVLTMGVIVEDVTIKSYNSINMFLRYV